MNMSCYPQFGLGTTDREYKVASMVLQHQNSLTLKQLQSMMSCCDEVKGKYAPDEIEEDVFSISGGMNNDIDDSGFIISENNDIEDCGVCFSEDAMTPCTLNDDYADGRSHMTRFDNQTQSFLSPQTKQLHRDLENNSAEKVCMPTYDSLNRSRKNMLQNIDYVKTFCDVENNPRIAKIWADMEQYVEKKQNEARDILEEETILADIGQKGRILMSGIKMKKKPPEMRLKGISG